MTNFKYPNRIAGARQNFLSTETRDGHQIAGPVDALVVTFLENVRYLTGFSGSNGMVILTENRALFVTDGRYTLQAQTEVPGFEIVILPQGTSLAEAAGRTLQELGVVTAGFEGAYMTVNAHKTLAHASTSGITLISRSETIEALRAIRDTEEIDAVRRATALIDECVAHLHGFIRPGRTEKEIAWEIETFVRTRGASKMGFDSIIGSGPNGAFIHGRATDRVLGSSGGPEFVLCDFGCELDGANSDITRTFVVGGEPTDTMRKHYDTVYAAQAAALDAIAPGRTGVEIDAIARGVIAAAGFGDMMHGLGHGLGRLVHDVPLPCFSPLAKVVLQPGIMATVEPGIYIEGVGGVRIEDDILVTETGCELLTKSPKELIVLG